MSVYLYDNAITEKIKSWTQSTDIHVYSPTDTGRLFEVIADTTNDKPIALPIICIRRNNRFSIVTPNKQPLSYDGVTESASVEKSLQINAIPISLSYQLDVYTRYLKEADEYIRNLIFNIINFPKLEIVIPYNGADIRHDSAISVAAEVQDNSDVPERLILGQFTRFTLNIDLSDAYLWDIRLRDNYQIEETDLTLGE